MDRDKVFVHMCGQMKCVSDDCQKKKSGTADITPSAERGRVEANRRNQEKRRRKRKHGKSDETRR